MEKERDIKKICQAAAVKREVGGNERKDKAAFLITRLQPTCNCRDVMKRWRSENNWLISGTNNSEQKKAHYPPDHRTQIIGAHFNLIGFYPSSLENKGNILLEKQSRRKLRQQQERMTSTCVTDISDICYPRTPSAAGVKLQDVARSTRRFLQLIRITPNELGSWYYFCLMFYTDNYFSQLSWIDN